MRAAPNTKLRKLEFSIFRERPSFGETPELLGSSHTLLVAVSGGADSVALLHVMSALQKRWGFQLHVAYVHHGDVFSANVSASEASRPTVSAAKTNRYRLRAEKKVASIAHAMGFPFSSLRDSSKKGDSEEALRELRMHVLEKEAEASGCAAIVLGHHQDDLFETRLIRLIRGTGPQGLQAMKVHATTSAGRVLWRPFLTTTRAEIETYLHDKRLKKNRDWLEDPSNLDARYLRNDIRKRLIPMLNRVRPGGATAMARSLQQIVDQVEEFAAEKPDSRTAVTVGLQVQSQSQTGSLSRAELLSMSATARRSHFAKWVRSQGLKGISKSHIEEILKRIDTRQKRLTFEIGGRVWTIDTEIRIGSTTR